MESGEIRRVTNGRDLVFDGTNAYIDVDISGFNLVGFEPETGIGVTSIVVSRKSIVSAGMVAIGLTQTVVSGEFRHLDDLRLGYGHNKLRLTANLVPAAGKKLGIGLST